MFTPRNSSTYIGCYKENLRRRVFNHNSGAIAAGTLTPQKCYTLCGGLKFMYAGLAKGSWCFCSNTNPALDSNLVSVTDGKCNIQCDGDPLSMCGSSIHISVYDALQPIKVTVDASPKLVATGNVVTLTETVETDGPGYKLSLDYDDNAGKSDPATSGTGLKTRTFHQAGQYDIITYATNPDMDLPEVTTATNVLVQSPVNNVTVICPPEMATYTPSWCTMEVLQGTDMSLTLDYTDGTPVISTFPIADALEYSIGAFVEEKITSPIASSVAAGTLVLQPAYPAEHAGYLLGLEYHAVTTGILTVHVYGPACSGEFCYHSNNCVTSGQCWYPTCGGNGNYCMDKGACCTPGVTPRSPGLLSTYILVTSITVSVSSGYNYYTLPTPEAIPAGAIIGHEVGGTPLLAQVAPDAGMTAFADYECPSQTGGIAITNSGSQCPTLLPEVNQLRGVYAIKSEIMVPLTFTTSGNTDVTATVNNRLSAISSTSVTASYTIFVMEGVNKAWFDIPGCLEANINAVLKVETFTGTTPSVYWDFGDGSTDIVTSGTFTQATNSYTTAGIYTVSVTINNTLSEKSNTTDVCVQERITGLELTPPFTGDTYNTKTVVTVGEMTDFTLDMATGTNYTCVIRMTNTDSTVETINTDHTITSIGGIISHRFTKPYDVVILTSCSNDINTATHSVTVRATETITGLALTPPGAIVNTNFEVLLTWTTGTDVYLSLDYDGVDVAMTLNEATRSAKSPSMIEAVTGPHPVNVTIGNVFGEQNFLEQFIIEVAITGAVLNCDYPTQVNVTAPAPYVAVIEVGQGVECTVDMTAGTSVHVEVDWDDGSTNYVYDFASGAAWVASALTQPIPHTFSTPGFEHVSITVSNNFNSATAKFPVMVMVGLENTQPDTIPVARFDPPAEVNVTFVVSSGPVPIGVTCTMDWGDGYTDNTECDVSTSGVITHYYDVAGIFTLTWQLCNLINCNDGTMEVKVITPIVNPTFVSQPFPAAALNMDIDLVFMADRAPGAGILDMEFDCNTAVGGVDFSRKREENSPNGQDIYTCQYASTGMFEAAVRTHSDIEDIITPYNVRVLKPVKDEFSITNNAPVDYEATNRCILDFRITYYGADEPDDAYVTLDYGDGTINITETYQTTIDISHKYATDGDYVTTITMFNDASSVVKTVPSGCYADFGPMTMTVLREALVPFGQHLPGFGADKDKFRVDETMKIKPDFSIGTFVWYELSAVSASDIFTCNSTDISVISLDIPVYGIFVLTVNARNPLYTGPSVTTTIEMIISIANVSISSDVITNAYDTKVFNVSMDLYGTAMCVAVFSGDLDEYHVDLYGDSDTCAEKSSADYPGFMAGKEGRYQVTTYDYTQSFPLFYQYMQTGTYRMFLYAWNNISYEFVYYDFPVSGIDCSAPNTDIKNSVRNPNYATKYPSNIRKKIEGITDIACPDTLKNTKRWQMILWNASQNVPMQNIDITSLSSSINSELSLQPNVYPYGVYKLRYKVTMDSSDVDTSTAFTGIAETFIEIVPSNVIVKVFNNSMGSKTYGHISTVTISPDSFSFDPDTTSGEDRSLTSFKIACRDATANEEFPDENVVIYAVNLEDLSPTHVDKGGCFKQGPGWIDDTDGSITFNADIFTVDHVYEFKVIGYKDTRTGTSYGNMSIVDGSPPDFNIDFKIPEICNVGALGKLRFNPNSQLGLVGNILNPSATASYEYLWQMYAWDTDYCDCCKCWKSLMYLIDYIEGIYSHELTVHIEVFEHYDTVNDFQVRLEITDTNIGNTGVTIINLERNTPPHKKNATAPCCTVDPPMGIATETLFTIECGDFEDDHDEIVSYSITCEADGETFPIASGTNHRLVNKTLPAGSITNDILECNVTVTDSAGATARYQFEDLVVYPLPLDDLKSVLSGMANSDNDDSDMIDAVANLDQTISFLTPFASSLNALSNDDEKVFEGIGTAVAYASTGLNDKTVRPGAFVTNVVNETAKAAYEEARSNAGALVNKVVGTFTKCTVESIAETEQLTKSLMSISKSLVFLVIDTQEKLVGLLDKSVGNLERNIDQLTVEEVESIGLSVIASCGNVEQAAVLGAEKPSGFDLKEKEKTVPWFDSNLYSKVKDVDSGLSEADLFDQGLNNMNNYEQTVSATSTKGNCDGLRDRIVNILANVKPISDKPYKMSSGSVETEVTKNLAESLANQTVETGAGRIALPAGFLDRFAGMPLVREITSKASEGIPEDEGGCCGHSRVLACKFKWPNGTVVKITNADPPIEIEIDQDQNKPAEDDSALVHQNPEIPRAEDYLFFHQLTTTAEKSALMFQFRPTLADSDHQLLVLVNYDSYPHLTEDKSSIKHWCLIPSHTDLAGTYGDDTTPDPYQCFVPSSVQAGLEGTWRIGVRQLQTEEFNMVSLPTTLPADWLHNETKIFTQNYKLKSVEVTCTYRTDGDPVKHYDGVEVSPLSTYSRIKCLTTHLTSFAGGWVVAPNTIDWDFIFSNADFMKNPTLYVTQIVIVVFYIMAMIWSRRQDRNDLTKLGLAPLLDNGPRDKYYYEILVNTGMRRNAGTESTVHFILSGEEEETEVRTFTDKKRKLFQRGETDGFLMAAPSELGALMYLRIWHDNSGKSKAASWYLNHIVIRDIQTDKKYYFICNRWFAVEEDDGQVDRVIPVAGKEQMTEFSHLFQERATKNLSDGHLWFSVVARPPQSRFTRCQRVSCCLCLLYTSMLANAMFYGTDNAASNTYTFGPFALTPEQIFIGIACNLIIFPVNFLIITIFRKSRPRKLRPSRVEEALKSIPERSTSMTDVNPRMKSSLGTERPGSSFLLDAKRSESALSRPESSMSLQTKVLLPTKAKKKWELPWFFLIIGWVLLWLVVAVSVAMVTFYGIQFQDIKCKKWITSLMVSTVTSVFFTQPIKVFLFAIIVSLIWKNPGSDEEDDDEEPERKMETDEELLHTEDDGYGLASPIRPMYKPKPPDSKSLEAARELRMKEIHMWAMIREILFYAFFLWILMVISYRSVSTNSYQYKYNMQKVFILTNDTKHAFTKVKNVQDFWVWAKSGMLSGLRAGPYYNNFPPFYLRGYINDKQSRLMGYAVLRQLRVKPDSCRIPPQVSQVITECNAPYKISLEQDEDYGPGWNSSSNIPREEYKYTTAKTLNGYPYWGEMAVYGGGGYIVRLNKSYFDMIAQFEQLEKERWIDEYTRAVFLEFTVYNPSINLFSISTLVSEFRPSGGVFPTYRFEPCMLLPYMNNVLLFQIACEIIYFSFTVFFIVKLFRDIYRQKKEYFFQFWNIVELGICSMSVTAIVIYFYRLVCINELTSYFKETGGDEYVKFQYVGYWTEIFNYIIGFLVYFATLKFLKLLRFNKKISLLADVLKNSAKDLIHFSIIFNIVFMAFIQVFYLVYVSHLDIFKTFTSSAEAGVVMMMGKFDIYAMLGVNQWLTQIFLFLFVVTITFIVVNMFLSILNDTFAAVRMDRDKQTNDYEIIDFMMNRFKLWTGIAGGNNKTLSPAEIEKEKEEKYRSLEGKIDYFPDQIDRFLASISHMYMEKSKFDDFLHQGEMGKLAAKANQQRHDNPGIIHPAPKPGTTRLSSGSRGMTDVQTD